MAPFLLRARPLLPLPREDCARVRRGLIVRVENQVETMRARRRCHCGKRNRTVLDAQSRQTYERPRARPPPPGNTASAPVAGLRPTYISVSYTLCRLPAVSTSSGVPVATAVAGGWDRSGAWGMPPAEYVRRRASPRGWETG